MKGEKRTYVIFSIILIIVSLLNRQYKFFGADYAVYTLFLAAMFLYRPFRKFKIPRNYGWMIVAFIGVVCVNAIISPFVPSPAFIALGTFFTLLPFIHFLVSYNVKSFSEKDIDQFIRLLIWTICGITVFMYVDTYVLSFGRRTGNAFIRSEFIPLGFFASILNQGVILCLAMWYKTKSNTFLKFTVLFVISSILTLQLKAIAGTILVLMLFLIYLGKGKASYFMNGVLAMIFVAFVIANTPKLLDKYNTYIYRYDITEQTHGVARVVLYNTAFKIAGDYFPLGTGQGTYGSIVESIRPSDVYRHYGINNVYGLEKGKQESFKFDTHWSNILGENGVLGLFLYLALMTYPMRKYRKDKSDRTNTAYWFIIIASPICIIVESISLAIPGKFAFIIVYAGLAGIILRHNRTNQKRTASLNA